MIRLRCVAKFMEVHDRVASLVMIQCIAINSAISHCPADSVRTPDSVHFNLVAI